MMRTPVFCLSCTPASLLLRHRYHHDRICTTVSLLQCLYHSVFSTKVSSNAPRVFSAVSCLYYSVCTTVSLPQCLYNYRVFKRTSCRLRYHFPPPAPSRRAARSVARLSRISILNRKRARSALPPQQRLAVLLQLRAARRHHRAS